MKNDKMKFQYRVNEQIRSREVRIVGDDVEAIVVPTQKALQMAEQKGLDLVEISPNAQPPVCRLIDYSKFLYQQKKRQKETQDTLNAIKPGNKVKTIGGICGTIVEVNEDTFVLETGTEKSGKSYLKFDKQAVYQTDAVPEAQAVETKEKANTEETNQTEAPEEEKAE